MSTIFGLQQRRMAASEIKSARKCFQTEGYEDLLIESHKPRSTVLQQKGTVKPIKKPWQELLGKFRLMKYRGGLFPFQEPHKDSSYYGQQQQKAKYPVSLHRRDFSRIAHYEKETNVAPYQTASPTSLVTIKKLHQYDKIQLTSSHTARKRFRCFYKQIQNVELHRGMVRAQIYR